MNLQSIIDIVRKYLATKPVSKAWLFGSYSRNEQTPSSDIDLLLRYDENSNVSLFTIGEIYMDLRSLLGADVDIGEEGTMRPQIEEKVNKDKILIYERQDKR